MSEMKRKRKDMVQVAHKVMLQATGAVEKKNPYDTTSTKRQGAHLQRLEASKGKRMPVDLEGKHLDKLEALVKVGYAASKAGVIRKAIDDAYAKKVK